MNDLAETPFRVKADDHEIDGLLHEGHGPLAALVLHPHPQYGGDMDNHVVMALCRVLAEQGATTLRFDFRRAGGAGEAFDVFGAGVADARAAGAGLRSAVPGTPTLVLAGYSFGAAVAAAAGASLEANALVLVSLPGQSTASLPDGMPTLIVTGERDEIAPPTRLRGLVAPRREVVVVDGADHFWGSGTERLATAVRSFAGNLQAEQ
jgi:alpha/beta superfamily hydrolase